MASLWYIILMTNPKNTPRSYPALFFDDLVFFEEEEDKMKQEAVRYEESTLSNPRRETSAIEDLLDSSDPSLSPNSAKKSLNHNFQKHAVVTIKKLLRFRQNHEASQVEKLAHLMWSIFMTSGLKSKKVLVILFGLANLKDEGYLSMLRKCGFGQVEQFGEEMVQQAQKILRDRLAESVTEQAVRQNLSNCRNIKLSGSFLAYFLELLRTIREGPLVKLRINDKTAKKLEAVREGKDEMS